MRIDDKLAAQCQNRPTVKELPHGACFRLVEGGATYIRITGIRAAFGPRIDPEQQSAGVHLQTGQVYVWYNEKKVIPVDASVTIHSIGILFTDQDPIRP